MPGKYYSDDLKEVIVRMAKEGMNRTQIAKKTGKPRTTIRDILARNRTRGTVN